MVWPAERVDCQRRRRHALLSVSAVVLCFRAIRERGVPLIIDKDIHRMTWYVEVE